MMRFSGRILAGRFTSDPPPGLWRECRVLWRGYIANKADVLKDAAAQGLDAGDGTTGDIFALAYRLWGDALAAHVHGEYSVAVYDDDASGLFLTTDAYALMPLFYGPSGDGVVFASHLEDILRDSGVGDLDEEYIADHVANPALVSERTPFKGLTRLKPGRPVFYTKDGGLAEGAPVKPAAVKPVTTDMDGLIEEFLALLGQGVRSAADAPGTVWCELSGGLDSSTVLAMAARSAAADLGAFSIVYDKYADARETEWMQLILRQYPVEWHRLDGDSALPYSEVPDHFCAEPSLDIVDWAGRRVYEEMAQRHGVGAVLTGQGGDVVFYGAGSEPYYLADLAHNLRLGALFHEIGRWRARDDRRRSILYWLVNYAVRPLVAKTASRPVRPVWHREMSPFVDPGYARRMALKDRTGRAIEAATVEGAWFRERLAAVCGQAARINQIPRSFEFRHPLLYRPLVEFMAALPFDIKYRPGTDRFLQRQALAGILPDPVRLRTSKTIYDQPCYEGLRQGRAFTDLLTDNPLIARMGIVDGGAWTEAVRQARMGRTHFLPQFEAMAALEIWLRQLDNAV